ncbi:hypothetical protein CTI12_AA313630 [Artemisia annua]|uniref:AAA+ ATPase domain-containing protein n=1 Tax=Artemisia annua TaxID=35608 RepID=A0A2U1N385_ARTAN|nr:hypothetical protein CTI12_AA313630 [Artemisia annua]
MTIPNVIAETLITSNNIPYATFATFFLMDYLIRRTMKFLRNSPEVDVIVGPLKDSMSAVDKVAPKWVSGLVSIVLISATVFGRLKEKEPNNVSFKDIIGIDAVISEFQKILSILLILPKISGCNIIRLEVPDGFLVYGPQRTGKTTLVHALAKQSRLPFFPIYARDIVKTGIQGLNRLFVEARRSSPSIIFIENIEHIAAKQENGKTDPILEELRNETDNCKKYGKEVMVIATTDKKEKLDPFMTKAGDTHVTVADVQQAFEKLEGIINGEYAQLG